MGATAAEIDRRLTTILCADVAGYSALMGRDEDGTLLRLKDYRDGMTGLIEHHRGRIANTAGDGVLAEFPSATEAVRAAIDIQRELGTRNDALPSDQQMHFRIGINVGDVMLEDGDLFGEGVNVAARLQELALPGCILISGPVYDLIHTKLDIGYEFLGEQQVKNIANEVPVYLVHVAKSQARSRATPGAAGTGEEPRPERRARSGPEYDHGPPEETDTASVIGPVARDRISRAVVVGVVIGVVAIAMGEAWMGIIGAVFLWLGLSHAALALSVTWRNRVAIQFLLVIGFLASINLLTDPWDMWFVYPGVPLLALAALSAGGLLSRAGDSRHRSSR